MLLRHADRKLQRLEEDPSYNAGLAENVVTAYRRRLQAIRSVVNENDLRGLKSLHFEKLCTFPEVGHLVRRRGRWWALQMRRLSPHAVVGHGHRYM